LEATVELPDEASRSGEDTPDAPATAGGGEPQADAHGIGPRVSAVFTAAERAAYDMMALAREQADDVRRKADAEAEGFLATRRAQAEDEARRILLEAEAEAHAIRHSAREMAREIEEKARRREQRVREEVDLILDRVDWAREGLEDVVARLEDVRPGRIASPSGGPAGHPPVTQPRENGRGAAGEPRAIEEAEG
jgi:hypothetical protein